MIYYEAISRPSGNQEVIARDQNAFRGLIRVVK